MSMRKRFLAMLSAAAMCLSAVPVSATAQEEPIIPEFDWIPSNFEEALEFEKTYGVTHIEDGVICLVFNIGGNSANIFDVVTTTDVASEIFHETYSYENQKPLFGYDGDYEVVVYKPFANGTFDVTLNITYMGKTREDSSYSFYVDESGEITETDLLAWIPDSEKEYDDFINEYGKISVHDNYVVYCAEVNGSTGATLTMEQNGTAELKKVLISDCVGQIPRGMAGNTSYYVEVYQPVSDGTVDVTWTVGREWAPESLISIKKTFEVSENGSVVKEIAPENERFFVVVGAYGINNYAQLRYVGENFAEKVVWVPVKYQSVSYGDVYVADGEVSMGRKQSVPDDPAYAMAYVSVLDGMPLTNVGNCAAIMDQKNLTVTDKTYDGSGHWTVRLSDVDGNEYKYGLNTVNSSLGVDITNSKIGDEYVFSFHNGNIVIPLTKVKSDAPIGDINNDGQFSVADIVLFQKWLLSVPNTRIPNRNAADLNGDGSLDVFDLTLMRKALVEQSQKSYEIPDGYIAVFHGGADDLSAETYIYKIDNGAANHGFEYINVTRSSFGVDHTEQVKFKGKGEVMWTDDVFTAAEANDAYDYVTIPGDDKIYTIEEFMMMFLMD